MKPTFHSVTSVIERNTIFLLVFLGLFGTMACSSDPKLHSRDEVISYLKTLGNGSYLFGQVATWVHNENPDMDHPDNWLKKVYDFSDKMPRYGVLTYDFTDNPFPDSAWNAGVKQMWDRGLVAGVYTFWDSPCDANPFRDTCDVDMIFDSISNPVKENFYAQMERMAGNLQWIRDQGIPVIYTPFVELDDSNSKWHARSGRENAIRLYRLVHDYFTFEKGLNNIIWAYHTREVDGAMAAFYPGDDCVDIIGKSGYGRDLNYPEYDWAVQKKKEGKIIWWAELGINDKDAPPRDCFDVLKKLEEEYPELAGFVFWSDAGHYNITGNLNGPQFISDKRIVTLK